MQNPPYFKTFSIIHLALIMGQVAFIAVAIGITKSTAIVVTPGNDIFFLIVPGFALMCLMGSSVVFKKLLETAKLQNNPESKLNAYRSASIVRYALIEAPSLFAIVVYVLNGNLYYIFIAVFMILFMFTLRPTKEKAEMDLNIRIDENGRIR